jgi:hypothetical protein
VPLLLTYNGRPIKRRHRMPGGLHLVFVSPVAGAPGDELDVLDADWQAHGVEQFFATKEEMPDVRAMAARFG